MRAFDLVVGVDENTDIDSDTTGVINASQPARNIQFALKLYY